MTTTIEDLMKITAMLGIPAICSVAWLITMLMSIKADIKKIELQLAMRNEVFEGRLQKCETAIHNTNNQVHKLVLQISKLESNHDHKGRQI